MTSKRVAIVIPRQGISTGNTCVRTIYSDESVAMLKAIGSVETRRASHVEPGRELAARALGILADKLPDVVCHSEAGGLAIHPAYQNHWFADMSPSGVAVVLGPFAPDARETALQEETNWLLRHGIPVLPPTP